MEKSRYTEEGKRLVGLATEKSWTIPKNRENRINGLKRKWDEIITKDFLIQEYVNNKKSIREISQALKCNHGVITQRLKDYNIQIKNRHEIRVGKHYPKISESLSRPEVRLKASLRMKRLRARQKRYGYKFNPKHISPDYFTNIEKITAEELTKRGIQFEHNAKIGPYYVDFLIFGKTILECDGFWHDSKKRKRYDARRDRSLIKKGFTVYRLGWKKIQEETINCISGLLLSRK